MSSKDQFNGLTPEQVHQILQKIATMASLMADMCREHAERAGGDDVAMSFHALDAMLCSVGVLADMPTGGAVVGDSGDWMLGPFFHENARKERRKIAGDAS